VLAIVIVIAVVAVVALVGVGGGGGGDDDTVGTASRSPRASSSDSSTTSTTTRPPVSYTVARGNTLTALARVFGVSTSAIIDANEGLNPDNLVEGQVLVIPSPEPLELVVTPRKPKVGGSIEIELSGAKEFEIVRFQIDRPTGPFIGPGHSASGDGVVTTSYELGFADPEGTYTVTAAGDQGTSVQTTFRVVR
jgi:LysM repeat protein